MKAEYAFGAAQFVATRYAINTDQTGTQLDPPAHWNEYGATISDLPPTVSLRPLCVIDLTAKRWRSPGYHAQPEDVYAWERAHGRIPAGSIVFFRTDYWGDSWAKGEQPKPLHLFLLGTAGTGKPRRLKPCTKKSSTAWKAWRWQRPSPE